MRLKGLLILHVALNDSCLSLQDFDVFGVLLVVEEPRLADDLRDILLSALTNFRLETEALLSRFNRFIPSVFELFPTLYLLINA